MAAKQPDHLFPEVSYNPGPGLRETLAAAPLLVPPPDDFADFTAADWDDVKRQALLIAGMKMLDSPDGHLAYIRGRISTAGHV
jgi:hypothetical protein